MYRDICSKVIKHNPNQEQHIAYAYHNIDQSILFISSFKHPLTYIPVSASPIMLQWPQEGSSQGYNELLRLIAKQQVREIKLINAVERGVFYLWMLFYCQKDEIRGKNHSVLNETIFVFTLTTMQTGKIGLSIQCLFTYNPIKAYLQAQQKIQQQGEQQWEKQLMKPKWVIQKYAIYPQHNGTIQSNILYCCKYNNGNTIGSPQGVIVKSIWERESCSPQCKIGRIQKLHNLSICLPEEGKDYGIGFTNSQGLDNLEIDIDQMLKLRVYRLNGGNMRIVNTNFIFASVPHSNQEALMMHNPGINPRAFRNISQFVFNIHHSQKDGSLVAIIGNYNNTDYGIVQMKVSQQQQIVYKGNSSHKLHKQFLFQSFVKGDYIFVFTQCYMQDSDLQIKMFVRVHSIPNGQNGDTNQYYPLLSKFQLGNEGEILDVGVEYQAVKGEYMIVGYSNDRVMVHRLMHKDLLYMKMAECLIAEEEGLDRMGKEIIELLHPNSY